MNCGEIFEDELVEVLEKDTLKEKYTLMLYNDDFNTFEYVIDVLMKYCKHEATQAEQCAHLVHYKGKCDIKNGEKEFLRPLRSKIADAGLKVAIV